MIIPESPRQRMTHKYWFAAGMIGLAVAFQLQATLIFYDTFVRIVLADLIAPVALGVAAIAFLRGRIGVSASRLPGLWIWLAALSAWMFVSLLVGREYTGDWQLWGVVNKFAGWFVLMGFLILGLLAGSVDEERFPRVFLKALLVFGWSVAAYALATLFLTRAGYFVLSPDVTCDYLGLYFSPEARAEFPDIWLILSVIRPECLWRLQGFMANPNAYGVFAAALLALQVPLMRHSELFAKHVHTAGFALMLAALVFAGSRTAWLALGVGLVALYALKALKFRRLGLAVVLAASLVLVTEYAPNIASFLPIGADAGGADAGGAGASRTPSSFIKLTDPQLWVLRAGSIELRLRQAEQALDLWSTNPILGIGLGGFLWEQARVSALDPSTIHGTGLWLLTETGLVGLALFLAFFAVCLRTLWPAEGSKRSPVNVGILAAMFVFAGASLGMEVMYQRHLWFLLGLGLALRGPIFDIRAATADVATDPAGRP